MLTEITSPAEIRKAWSLLERSMAKGAVRVRRTVGSRDGAHPRSLIVREDLGVWMIPAQHYGGRLWCPFGPWPTTSSGNLGMTVQINPPLKKGSNSFGRLAQDETGGKWICHTGKLGGKFQSVTVEEFVTWTGRAAEELIRPNGRTRQVLPLARLGDARMLNDIAAFVHQVAQFKAGEGSALPPIVAAPFSGSEDEREGSTIVASRSGYEMKRVHAEVRNRLAVLLREFRPDTVRDRLRDIVVGKPSSPDFEFEIKPASDLQSLYTGIGQLLMHAAARPSKRKVIVIPGGLAADRAAAIQSLGIHIVTFGIVKDTLHFDGLDAILPGIKSRIPLHPSKS